MEWETVIGLEIHIQLATKSKLFSTAATDFGAEPNTHVNEVDAAIPGTLPVLNSKAVDMAIKLGLSLNSSISRNSFFERKNYFYPDLPKGYQTTQLANPIIGPGSLTIALADGSEKTIRIHHGHLEEDAGKSTHSEYTSYIDLNRAGIPLVELVTEPDLSNAEEAIAFATKIHSIVKMIGICDGKMEQGSMRFDINVSVKPKGSLTLGTRTETKNLNSFKFMKLAINSEITRQIAILEAGGSITQETRLFNGITGESRSLRSKETESDYRYFPCPDLLTVKITEEKIKKIQQSLPELPDVKKQRFIENYQLNSYDAELLTANSDIANYFEKVTELSKDAKLAANWMLGTITGTLNTKDISILNIPVSANAVADIILRIKDATISNKIGKTIFNAIWDNPEKSVDTIIKELNLEQVSDTAEISKLVDSIIANNPQQVANYCNAIPEKRAKMLGFFVGQCMKLSKGKANPAKVNGLILQKLNQLL